MRHSGIDLVDLDLRIKLSVTVFLVIAFFGLILVNDNLSVLRLSQNSCAYGRSGNSGSADCKLSVADSQNLIKGDRLSCINSEFFNLTDIAL